MIAQVKSLLGPLDRKQARLFRSAAILAIVLEILAFTFHGAFSTVAARLWLAFWILSAAAAAVFFVLEVVDDVRSARDGLRTLRADRKASDAFLAPLLSLVALAGLLALLLAAALDLDRIVIGQDATQQIGAGLSAFRTADWNYTGTAFLGYPARQYLIAALPPLALGRSFAALQLGFGLPFAFALMAFFSGMKAFARSRGLHPTLPATATLFLAVFPYVTEYFLYFEHTLFPLCFTTMAIGFLLRFLAKPSLVPAATLAWSGAAMAACYTPALASLALFVVALLLLAVRTSKQGGPAPVVSVLYASSAVGAFFGAASLSFGRSDRVTQMRSEDLVESLAAMKAGYSIFFLNIPAVFTGLFVLAIAVWLVLALVFRLGPVHFVAAGWVLAVVGLSQFLRGYSVYEPPISMSRSLVTVPVIAACLPIAFHAWWKRRERRHGTALAAAFVVIAFVSLAFNLSRPFVQGDAKKYFGHSMLQAEKYVLKDMLNTAAVAGIDQEDPFLLVYGTETVWFLNMKDYAKYFFPNARVVALRSGESLPEDLEAGGAALVYLEPGYEGDPFLEAIEGRSLLEVSYREKVFYRVERKTYGWGMGFDPSRVP